MSQYLPNRLTRFRLEESHKVFKRLIRQLGSAVILNQLPKLVNAIPMLLRTLLKRRVVRRVKYA